MRNSLPLIEQSLGELQELLKAEREPQRYQRLHMLYLLKGGFAATRQQLAEILCVHRHSIGAWLESYKRGGLAEMLTIGTAPGKDGSLNEAHIARIRQRLQEPNGIASYSDLQRWISKELGITLSYAAVYYWAHIKLGVRLKIQRSRKRRHHYEEPSTVLKIHPKRRLHLHTPSASVPRPAAATKQVAAQ
jgi:transposase